MMSFSVQTQRNIRLISIHNFFVNFEPYMPIAILYFAKETGSFALGMTIFAIVMISSAIFEVPTGILSDYVGRKKTIILGSIAGIFGVFFYALGGSFWIFALGSVFEGLARSFYSGNNDAMLHDSLKQDGQEEEYAHILGRTSSYFQAGLGVSALLGSLIAYFFPLRFVFWSGVIPRALCIVMSLLMIEPKIHGKEISTNIFSHCKEALLHFKRNAKLRTLSIASVLNFGVSESTYMFTPAFFSTLWPVWAIGFARVIANITAFIGFRYAGAMIKRFQALRLLIVSKVSTRFIALFAYIVPTILSPLLISLSSIFYGLVRTAEGALFQQEFTDKQRATMGSLNQFAGSIFFGVFAFCFGFVADKIGPAHSLIVTELILFAIIYLYWRLFRHG